LVTGATRGIGRACATLLAETGWNVVGVGRDREALAQLEADLGERGVVLEGDVTSRPTNETAVRVCLEQFGALDAVVGNAGITLSKTIDSTTDADFDRLVSVNLRALVYLAQVSHRPLAERGGSLTVVASNKGLVAQPGSPIYVATKGAAVQLSKALALDWAADGIRVNAVCPGVVDTAMLRNFVGAARNPHQELQAIISAQPIGRLATPSECASVVRFLSSPEASYVTGIALPVDGGFTAQ
jgi:NAD(P)-dependent dehydrogenase (short-subunit alcohol dehydrogenase family)